MAIQLIRLSQIRANLPEFVDFEQQLAAMFGEENTERYIATENQQTFTLTNEYMVGRNALKVFVNGILQNCGPQDGYIEVNSKMISFTEPLYKGDCVVIVRNNFSRYASLMGKERVKAYNIYRQTYFVTENNVGNLTFNTPMRYQVGLNQLKVWINGILQVNGAGFDYVELNENQFKMNYGAPIGSTITVEVTSGGLRAYRCERFPIFIDANKTTQREFVLPITYKVGENNLKVYLGGQLIRKGPEHDYIELTPSSFKMNYDLPVGIVLEAEVTTFTVDVFKITRVSNEITEDNKHILVYPTSVPYTLGESNLRVYYNGILLREGVNEDYVEIDENTFKLNFDDITPTSVVEYEIINW